MSGYREKVHDRDGDQRYFSRTADQSHYKNFMGAPLRGGIRL